MLGGFEQAQDIVFARDVGLNGDSAAAVGENVSDYFFFLRLRSGGEVNGNGVSAFGRERGDGRADSATGSSHDECAEILVCWP